MKIKNLTKFFLFVAVAVMSSCSSSSDDGNGGNGNGLNAITVSASSQYVDFGTEITFTVTTNKGDDVTSEAIILVDDQGITGNAFTATSTGQYNVTATYEDLTSAAVTVTVLPVIVSIEIRSANTVYNLGERIDFQVIALDNDGGETDVTGGSTVAIDGTESFSGASYVPGSAGTLDADATFNEFTSNIITVSVEDNASTPASYDQKALIEDYTGTWCGWCPRVSYGIELAQQATAKVAVVAVHSGDQMSNSYGNALIGAFNPGGSYPTAIVNRDVEWTYPEPNNIGQITTAASGTNSTGLSIVTARKGSNLSLMVNAGFGQNLSGAKLVVLLLENGLIYDQENYTSYYNGDDVLNNFVHDHVLRYAFTNPLGDAIPAGEMVAGNTYRMKYDFTMPTNIITNALRTEVVAMVVDSNNKIINVTKVNVGNNVDF
ncbi:Omp28-related outer membrane protein [Psychroserpens ponticola]|uniref:Omp28-related outer membrane protein n=1 Tax=Psychroserpens ponticola TaxID=2932268 RepID=A0ABY7RXY1_9FLAO|nr:Omp28-related outer membrane protein [Psychroserpens ponticola]WCO01096.1 Omp28-related outer membrane protein [Psychroserpens ponticola]